MSKFGSRSVLEGPFDFEVTRVHCAISLFLYNSYLRDSGDLSHAIALALKLILMTISLFFKGRFLEFQMYHNFADFYLNCLKAHY